MLQSNKYNVVYESAEPVFIKTVGFLRYAET